MEMQQPRSETLALKVAKSMAMQSPSVVESGMTRAEGSADRQ